MMPTSRECSTRRLGWRAQSSKSAGAPSAATPRTRRSRAPAQMLSAPPVPKPASHTPLARSLRLRCSAAAEDVVEPPVEREIALRTPRAPRIERQRHPAHLLGDAIGERGMGRRVPTCLDRRRTGSPARGRRPAARCGRPLWGERRARRAAVRRHRPSRLPLRVRLGAGDSRGCAPRPTCRGRRWRLAPTRPVRRAPSGPSSASRSYTTWRRLSPRNRLCSYRIGRSTTYSLPLTCLCGTCRHGP